MPVEAAPGKGWTCGHDGHVENLQVCVSVGEGASPREGLSVSLTVRVALSLETQLWDPCPGATR